MANFDELVRSLSIGVTRPQVTIAENCLIKLMEMKLAALQQETANTLKADAKSDTSTVTEAKNKEKEEEEEGEDEDEEGFPMRTKKDGKLVFSLKRIKTILQKSVATLRDNAVLDYIGWVR